MITGSPPHSPCINELVREESPGVYHRKELRRGRRSSRVCRPRAQQMLLIGCSTRLHACYERLLYGILGKPSNVQWQKGTDNQHPVCIRNWRIQLQECNVTVHTWRQGESTCISWVDFECVADSSMAFGRRSSHVLVNRRVILLSAQGGNLSRISSQSTPL